MTDIITTGGLGGNGFGGEGLAAFGGALVGSWFGNGWMGNGGFGGNGFGAGFATSILNDGVNAIQNSINGMNMNLSSGLSNIGYQTLDQSSRNQLAMMQGFSSLGHDNCQNTSNIVSAINNVGFMQQECCCKTQNTIREEGSLTRALIQQNQINDLQTKLCDAKHENATLASQIFTTNALNGQTAAILGAINARFPLPATTTPTA